MVEKAYRKVSGIISSSSLHLKGGGIKIHIENNIRAALSQVIYGQSFITYVITQQIRSEAKQQITNYTIRLSMYEAVYFNLYSSINQ